MNADTGLLVALVNVDMIRTMTFGVLIWDPLRRGHDGSGTRWSDGAAE